MTIAFPRLAGSLLFTLATVAAATTCTSCAGRSSDSTDSAQSELAPLGQTYALPGQVQASGYSALTGTMKLEACSDTGGGQDLGYTSAGGTVTFNVTAAAAGSFNATYRVASAMGGSFDVALDGSKVDTIEVANTGGWQTWTTVSGTLPYSISAGSHVLQLTEDAVAYNLNWIGFTANVTPTYAVPGRVQASGYSALTGTLKLEPCTDTGGGQDLGYTSVGATAKFNLSAAAPGSYSATYRVASAVGGSFDVALDGSRVDTIQVANTGGWQSWTTVSGNASYAVSAGNHVLELSTDAVAYNVNWIDFASNCTLPGGSYAASCTACSAGVTSAGCTLTCASCTEVNGSQNAGPTLPLPCASGSVSNINGGLVCDSGPPPGASGAPRVVPATGGSGAHLVTVGSTNRLELHGVVVWGIEDFVTTSFADGQHSNRDAIAANIAAWGGNVIRLRVLADEYVHLSHMGSTANYLQWVKDWVGAAEAHGLYVQICWWDSLDSSDGSKNDGNWASQYAFAFPMMTDVHSALKRADGTDDPSVFYEPFNEPNHVSWDQWLPAMEAAVSEFRRTAGYQGMLIIDTTTWSHDYSDQYMGQLETYDATLTASRQSNLAFARHDYTNDYGNNFTGGAWIGNTGGGETAHVMYETEFGNYNGGNIQSNAWSAAITSYFKTDLFDRSNIAGADAFLFGNWSDANAISSDPSGNAPTNPWGNDVENWLSAYK